MRDLTALVFLIFVAAFGMVVVHGGPHDSKLSSDVTDLDSLHLVTEKPHRMFDITAALCRSPDDFQHNVHEGFIRSAYCNVYVNETAKNTMLTGKGVYPVDSLIVKSKLLDKDKPNIELYTVMRKMPMGYDPEHGDWEYSIIDGESKRVFAAGRIGSCIDCHAGYKDTDYVTRVYLSIRDKPSDAPKPQ